MVCRPNGKKTKMPVTEELSHVLHDDNVDVPVSVTVAFAAQLDNHPSSKLRKGDYTKHLVGNVYYKPVEFFQVNDHCYAKSELYLPSEKQDGRFLCLRNTARRRLILLRHLSRPLVNADGPDDQSVFILNASIG